MTILFAGSEDECVPDSVGAVGVSSPVRTAFCRAGVQTSSSTVGQGAANYNAWSASALGWFTARAMTNGFANHTSLLMGLTDSSGVTRLLVRAVNYVYSLYKRNAAGTETLLATATAAKAGLTTTFSNKLDWFYDYQAAGAFRFYIDGVLIVSYSGDVTTDAITALTGFTLNKFGDNQTTWSEMAFDDAVDTRGIPFVMTAAPVANGNSTTFATGGVTSVNETILNDATSNTSDTANQLQQYTIAPTGNAQLRAVVESARVARGATGPQNFQGNLRLAGVDYFSSTIAPTAVLDCYQAIWSAHPAGGALNLAQFTAAGVNIGLKSIA